MKWYFLPVPLLAGRAGKEGEEAVLLLGFANVAAMKG